VSVIPSQFGMLAVSKMTDILLFKFELRTVCSGRQKEQVCSYNGCCYIDSMSRSADINSDREEEGT
jgi:hypothetical protein